MLSHRSCAGGLKIGLKAMCLPTMTATKQRNSSTSILLHEFRERDVAGKTKHTFNYSAPYNFYVHRHKVGGIFDFFELTLQFLYSPTQGRWDI